MLIWDHVLIGTAIGLSNQSDNPAVLITTISSSVFPDVDLIFGFPGSINYLKNHRTFTHSLLFAPVYAFLLSIFFSYLYSDVGLLTLWGWSLLGILSHLLVDIMNGFGAAIWYPLNKKRIAYDVFYEYDFIFSGLFVIIISFQLFAIYYFPNNLLYLNIFSIIILGIYFFSRIKSKNRFINLIKVKSNQIEDKIVRFSCVPASYWRWKAILESDSNNYIFRIKNREVELEKRPKQIIPSNLFVSPARIYFDYARHLDVSIMQNKLILENLIYSSKTYKLIIIFDELNKYSYTISLPSLSPSEY